MSNAHNYIPWRDRAFLSVPETADVFSQSSEWVRNEIVAGRLSAFRLPQNGALGVSVGSIARMIDCILGPAYESSIPHYRRPTLRLVIDNTKS